MKLRSISIKQNERSKGSLALVVGALAAATALKLYLALTTAGSLDAAAFTDHLAKIEQYGDAVYLVRGAFDNPFNSPPFIIHTLKALGWLARATHLPFVFWLRLPCILADIGGLFVVRRLLMRLAPARKVTVPLLLLALSPISIIISGYHGNFDPVMIFFVLLAIDRCEGGDRAWIEGLIYGLAINIKIVPVLFAPALWFYLRNARSRAQFFGAAALLWFLCSLPYIAREPLVIARAVFGYGSLYGQWGWTFLLAQALPASLRFAHQPHDVIGPHAVYAAIGKWLMLALIFAASFSLNRGARKPSLFLQLGLIVSLFLALTPGFGSQYLAWLVPLVAALELGPAVAYHVFGGLYLFVGYSCFIYRATPPSYCPPTLQYALMLACWATVLLALGFYCRLLFRRQEPPRNESVYLKSP